MMSSLMAVVFGLLIFWLFRLDGNPKATYSRALWIPILWLWFSSSRSPSRWLDALSSGSSAATLSALEGNPLDRNIYLALLLVGMGVLCCRQARLRGILGRHSPVLIYFAYCAVSTLWSDHTDVAFKRWLKALGDLVMVLIVLTEKNQTDAFRRVLTAVGFQLIPLSVLFVKYYPELGRMIRKWVWTPMYTGVCTTKNELGMTCLIFGLASLWCFCGAYSQRPGPERTRRMTAHGVILGFTAYLFWIADSMTSLACFFMAGSAILLTSLGILPRRPATATLYIGAVFAACYAALFLDLGAGALETMGRNPTLTGRTETWEIVLGLVSNPLGGAGYESFWISDALRRVAEQVPFNQAHNGYIETYLNLGWIGVILLAVVILAGFRNVAGRFGAGLESGSLHVALFATVLVYNLTEASFKMMSPIWIVFLVAVMADRDAGRCSTRRFPAGGVLSVSLPEQSPAPVLPR